MIKGFIKYHDGKIPFVIENYVMELFTDDSILLDFTKEYNFQKKYTLCGISFNDLGHSHQRFSAVVDYSIGNRCYLICYTIESFFSEEPFDGIGFQSSSLDDIFRYRYNYLDLVRSGVNLAVSPKNIYAIPFELQRGKYELKYSIGQNERAGLLEDIEKRREVLISLKTGTPQECYTLTVLLQRVVAFIMSRFEPSFKKIALYRNDRQAGWFYCNLLSNQRVPKVISLLLSCYSTESCCCRYCKCS